ncbi:PREDICTED: elicitor peptide 1-like [Camelina sativa]|uniref:Elicitor peptide 1-like n=1 Tax=Camelina sativa TaxID=90675 RepID=A0ABM0UQ87_CAMSA|nr:PREDICTED: elicitor peptide 1-like [Camelina sativa]
MEKSDRRSEEATYLWIPLQCLDRTLKAILRCLGLFHQDSPSSSPGTSNQPEEEEEEDVTEKEEVVVTSRGMKHGVVVTSRAIKNKTNRKGKEGVSSGRRGQHN